MRIDNFQQFLKHCKIFVARMNEENIPKDLQKTMLKAYITGYIARNNHKIHFQDSHITELIS